jgi:oxidase EvaA
MKFKRNIKYLNKIRRDINSFKHKENKDIKPIIKWVKSLQRKIKTSSQIINIDECENWFFDKRKNLYHKSGQFFKIKAVKTTGASNREVKSWTQPILTQKHGGVLAFICRKTQKKGIEFLIEAKIEPGDDSIIKISPSFQATQSNMNQAHGGDKPKLFDIVINQKKSKLVYYTIHNEEGARFWKKSNWNILVKLDDPNDKRIKGENYKWVSYTQIKKLALKDRLVNPFVKTILFMI